MDGGNAISSCADKKDESNACSRNTSTMSLTAVGFQSDIAQKLAASHQRRIDQLKFGLQDALSKKMRLDRVGESFKKDIAADSPYLFEKVIREF